MLTFRLPFSSIARTAGKIGTRAHHRGLTNSPLGANRILEHEHKMYATLETFGHQELNTLTAQ